MRNVRYERYVYACLTVVKFPQVHLATWAQLFKANDIVG